MDESLMGAMAADADEEANLEPSDDKAMSRLVEFGNELEELRGQLDELKEKEKEIKGRYDHLRFVLIPDLMQKVGLVGSDGKGRFTNSAGGLISLRTDTHAGYSKSVEDKVFDWLRKGGMGDVIRETVHPSTFKALVREQLADGKKLPDFVSVHYETSAMLRRSKQ